MEDASINPITLFMLTGLVVLLALVVFRAGAPFIPIRRWVDRWRNASASVDVLFEAVDRVGAAWRGLLLPVGVWIAVDKLSWEGLGLLHRGAEGSASYSGMFQILMNALPLIYAGFAAWCIRVLMKQSGEGGSFRSPGHFRFAAVVVLLAFFAVSYRSGASDIVWSLIRSLVIFDFSIWFGSEPIHIISMFLLLAVFGLVSLLLPWVPQALAGRRLGFGLFVQSYWRLGLWLSGILLIAATIAALVSLFVWELQLASFQWSPKWAFGALRPWLLWTIGTVLRMVFDLWQLAIIVAVSERARAALTPS